MKLFLKLCISSMVIWMIVLTYVDDSYAATTFTVYKDKTISYKGKKSSLHKSGYIKTNRRMSHGTYPKRKGVILVTATGRFANMVGHSAIIYSAGYIIESIADGVVISRNNWKVKKKNMAAVTVRGTTVAQDAKVSDWCRKQKGKKYNFNYYNMGRTNAYYCSQLIWAGYKYLCKINLNTRAYDIGKLKAIGPFEYVRKSSSVMFPIYMKNWNRSDVTN